MDNMTKFNLPFLAGIALALIGTFITEVAAQEWFVYALVLVGLIIGFVNVTTKESLKFIVAYIGLSLVSGTMVALPILGEPLTALFANILAVFGPATLVVVIRELVTSGGSK